MAERILKHKPGNAGAGVEHGEDKKRLEHDGKVIPKGHYRLAAQGMGKDLSHANGERRRAASAVQQGLLADGMCQRSYSSGAHWKAPGANGGGGGIR